MAPSPASVPASGAAAEPAPEPNIGRNGLLLGIELGVARGLGDAESFGITELSGQAGWASHGRAALFATGSVGILGASEAGVFASFGVGARIFAGRAFLDLRVERMRVVAVECEEDCSSLGVNRFTGGIGVDAVRGPHGGMQLAFKVTHLAEVTGALLSIGGYVDL
ncbi:MAG TPA: hypothetical protein VLM79_16220 [Kofleriaceae bacterium]|nr:hypothetical protein [Kofleriaceae bacterium]